MTKQLTLNQVVKELKTPDRGKSQRETGDTGGVSASVGGGGGGGASSLEAALAKKKSLEREIHTLEKQIFALETSYLENTAQIGDLVRGWGDIATALNAVSNSASSSSVSGSALTNMKKRKVMDSERIFSLSSVSARELIHQQQQLQYDDAADDSTDFLSAGRPSKIPKSSSTSSSKKRTGPGRKKSIPAPANTSSAPSLPASAAQQLGTPAMEPLFVQPEQTEISDI